jgi:uncharacterized protein YciU (UPF0263 family)
MVAMIVDEEFQIEMLIGVVRTHHDEMDRLLAII